MNDLINIGVAGEFIKKSASRYTDKSFLKVSELMLPSTCGLQILKLSKPNSMMCLMEADHFSTWRSLIKVIQRPIGSLDTSLQRIFFTIVKASGLRGLSADLAAGEAANQLTSAVDVNSTIW